MVKILDSIVGDVVESRIELRLEVAIVVFAEDDAVRCMATTLGNATVNKCFESGGVDIVAMVVQAVAEGTAIVEVDVGVGLQRAVGTIGALTNSIDSGKGDFGTHGFNLAHANGVDVAKDDIGYFLGGDVAEVFLVGINVVGSPLRIFETAGAFFVAGFHYLDRLGEEGADEIVEVVLIATIVGAVVEDDASKLRTRSVGNGTKPVVEKDGTDTGGSIAA